MIFNLYSNFTTIKHNGDFLQVDAENHSHYSFSFIAMLGIDFTSHHNSLSKFLIPIFWDEKTGLRQNS